jgi:hypothetical protein
MKGTRVDTGVQGYRVQAVACCGDAEEQRVLLVRGPPEQTFVSFSNLYT